MLTLKPSNALKISLDSYLLHGRQNLFSSFKMSCTPLGEFANSSPFKICGIENTKTNIAARKVFETCRRATNLVATEDGCFSYCGVKTSSEYANLYSRLAYIRKTQRSVLDIQDIQCLDSPRPEHQIPSNKPTVPITLATKITTIRISKRSGSIADATSTTKPTLSIAPPFQALNTTASATSSSNLNAQITIPLMVDATATPSNSTAIPPATIKSSIKDFLMFSVVVLVNRITIFVAE